jgi:hypothetical protein
LFGRLNYHKYEKCICYIVQLIKKIIYWKEEKTDYVKMKTKRWKHIRNYSILIYDENAMEIGNKITQYNVRKMKHAIITQRYKCLLHARFW